MNHRVVVPALALLGLAACAGTSWIKPGAGPQDFAAASTACQDEARQKGQYALLTGPARMREIQEDCLAAHGWSMRSP